MVENLINLELAYINTMHPEFKTGIDLEYMINSDHLDNQINQGTCKHLKVQQQQHK